MALRPGDRIDGKYLVVAELGVGGMGAVYEGLHEAIKRRVAIKVMHAHLAREGDMARRFENEAQAAGCVESRHIAQVHDAGALPSGERYMVMEFLEGESLRDRLQRDKRLDGVTAARLVMQLLRGLAKAHAAGIVHRDLKPANVYLTHTEDGEDLVKVLDFGVSKFHHAEGAGLTHTGSLIGTPHYMAPEQAKGAKNADARSDVFSVGVILFRALSGRLPFVAESIPELLVQIVTEPAPPLLEAAPGIDPALAAIVDKALARDPGERYGSALELRSALATWLCERTGEVFSHPTDPSLTPRRTPPPPLPRSSPPATLTGADVQTLLTPSPSSLQATPGGGPAAQRRWQHWLGLGAAVSIGGLLALALARGNADDTGTAASVSGGRSGPASADAPARLPVETTAAAPSGSGLPVSASTASALPTAATSVDAAPKAKGRSPSPPARAARDSPPRPAKAKPASARPGASATKPAAGIGERSFREDLD